MRRTLKPFITEYKGTVRRQPASMSEAALAEANRPEAKRPVPNMMDFSARPDSDDSYEAAMRAADALFAPSEPRATPSPAPRRDDVQPFAEIAPARDEVEAVGAPKNGGRILRVLDEAPPPELVALEIERAPKRRGRKPGSKNKPKVVAALTLETLEPATPPASFVSIDIGDDEPEVAVAPVRVPALRQVAAIPSGVTPPKNDKRNAWMRDKLRPGEEWKRRRLPRVCW